MGEKDIAEKNFEAYNDVFADIANGSMFHGEQIIKADRLIDARTSSQYKDDGKTLHEQERDVAKFCLDAGCHIRLALLGIENQTVVDLDMPLRVIGYDGASYREEINQDFYECDGKGGKRRRKRYPVLTIVLYFGVRPWNKPLSLYDAVEVPDYLKPFVSDYKINVVDVPRLTAEGISFFHSDFKILADYFVQLRQYGTYKPDMAKIRHVDSFLKLMAVLNDDERFAEVYRELVGKEGGVSMCEVLDRAEARGMEKLNKLYGLLSSWGRDEDLLHAIRDESFRRNLLEQYKAQLV